MPKKYYLFFTLPTIIAFLIAFFVPFLMGIYLSFTTFTTVTNARWVGISNYMRAFAEEGLFLNATVFTAKFAIVSVISVNVLAFLLAMVLTKKIRGTNAFRTTFFMPNLIGGIVLGYIWLLIINGILINFGVDITFDARYGFWGLVVLTNSFKLFDQNLSLTAGAPSRQTAMMALDIFDTFYGRNGYEGVGQAKAAVFSLLVAVIVLIQLGISRRREVEG